MEVRGSTKDLGKGTKAKQEGEQSKALVPAKKEQKALTTTKKKPRKKKKKGGNAASRNTKAASGGAQKKKKKKKGESGTNGTALVLWDPKTQISARDNWIKRLVKHVGGVKGVSTVTGTAVALGVAWKAGGKLVESQALRAVIPVIIGLPALAAKNRTVARIGGTAAALGIFALALEGYHRVTKEDEPVVASAKPKKNGKANGTEDKDTAGGDQGGTA